MSPWAAFFDINTLYYIVFYDMIKVTDVHYY